MLIVEERLGVDPAIEPVAIGKLMRPSSGHPVAMISIEAAKHLVSSVPGRAGEELAAVDERRLGKVLGRTLAHEIGHYLLDTPTHARSGLMRPNFDAFEFIDLRDGAFALDRAAAAWLRTARRRKIRVIVPRLLHDNSVDVIMSNCVINLSGDKDHSRQRL